MNAMLFLVLSTFFATTGVDSDADGAMTASSDAVREIFTIRCGACHGADLPKPKGKFGHVTDLERLAKEPRFLVPGDPDNSEIYLLLVEEDPEFRMPPESSKTGMLSSGEIDTVRRWIASGAKSGAAETGEDAGGEGTGAGDAGTGSEDGGGSAGDAEPVVTTPTSAPEAYLLMARLHPAIVHMPIGLLIAAAVAELLAMLTRGKSMNGTVRFCLWLGMLSSLAAAGFGWLAGEYQGYSGFDLDLHRWIGVGTAALAFLATIVCEVARRKSDAPCAVFRTLLFLTAAAVAVGGHFGGVLVHGVPW